MNLSIGILLSAVSSITSPANCSAVWYAHKHPLVCAVFISILLLTLFGILLGMGSLCLLILYRNEVIFPLPHNSCWHSLHPKFLAELSIASWGEFYRLHHPSSLTFGTLTCSSGLSTQVHFLLSQDWCKQLWYPYIIARKLNWMIVLSCKALTPFYINSVSLDTSHPKPGNIFMWTEILFPNIIFILFIILPIIIL